MKGSHIPKTKVSLSDSEREVLGYLLEPLLEDCSFAATSLDIDEMLKNTNVVKGKRWTHHSTTELLSNLVGMDLLSEETGFTEVVNGETKVNNHTPVYVIEKDSIIHNRASYAFERDNSKGITLFNIIRGDDEFGVGLWPFRPNNRVKLEGKVDENGRLHLPYYRKDFMDMIGKTVSVTIQA